MAMECLWHFQFRHECVWGGGWNSYASSCKGGLGELPQENFVIMEACSSNFNAPLISFMLRKLSILQAVFLFQMLKYIDLLGMCQIYP